MKTEKNDKILYNKSDIENHFQNSKLSGKVYQCRIQ